MKILITGGCGFIGSNLASRLLNEGHIVIVVDNLSRGSQTNIEKFVKLDNFQFYNLDISNYNELENLFEAEKLKKNIDEVWHLAANSDIPAGIKNIDVDYKDTFLTTFNLIKCLKKFKIKKFMFASTSAIYGDLGELPIHESSGPLFPISNYGAMKLASEALISSAVESFLAEAYIFRFPNVIGVPATHGVIFDFIEKLNNNPKELNVLGNGTQRKTYLHVEELLDAMFFIIKYSKEKLNYFNIGNVDNGTTVKFIAEELVNQYSTETEILYGNSDRGWVGDVPKFNYSIDKLLKLGWKPKLNSNQTIIKAIEEILIQLKKVN